MKNSIIKEDIKAILDSDFIDFEQLSNANFVVTGASGMLCSFVVKTLLQVTSGKVFAVFRNKKRFDELFDEFLQNKNLVAIECDIAEFDHLTIKEDVDYIIHGASVASPITYTKNLLDAFNANCLGMLRLLDLAKVKNVKNIVFISSASIYGDVGMVDGVKEEYVGSINTLEIRSCYSESKRMTENLLFSWCKMYGKNFSIIRPFHTYGPGMKLDDGRIFADVVAAVVNRRNIVVNSDGSAIRVFCYVADFTSALLAIISSKNYNQAWNVGSAQDEISMIDLANMIKNIIPDSKISVVFESGGRIKSAGISKVVPDVSKLYSIGWRRKFDLKSGFKRTIEYYLHKA